MRPTPSEPGAPERDRGYTLIEMLVAIVLMGGIVLSIMGGMWGVVRASKSNDERAKVQAVLGVAADALIASTPHVYCPEPKDDNVFLTYITQAKKAADSVGWEKSTVEITSYKYWNSAAGTWSNTNSSLASGQCSKQAAFTPNQTMQLITLRVTSPSGSVVGTLDVVKTDVRAKGVTS
jgi:prepilin-type N-terminal cleavage/methylation domain-containing protein